MKLSVFFGLMLALMCNPASAQTQSICDQQTGPPGSTTDLEAVAAACAASLAAKPGDTEATFRYALALERAGRLEDALRMYQWAADDGYDPANDAVQRLVAAREDTAASDWDLERAELGRNMAGIATAMRRFENRLPPDLADPLSVIAEIGTDPAVITDWVRTHTRLVPYLGSLRGARGVLADRHGNSLDRALALSVLLAASGEDIRLARAGLTEAQARQLLVASKTASVEVPAVSSPTAQEVLELAQTSGVREDIARQAIDQAVEERARLDASIEQQMPVLLPLLARATESVLLPASAAQEQRAIEQLQDHFWVQAQRGDIWVDFDPDARELGPLIPAEVLSPDTVPDALRHAVTIRVIVEIRSTSGRREETLVSWTGFPSAQSETLVTLSHTTDTIDAISQLVTGGGSPEQLLAAVDRTVTWTPLLRVGDQVTFDKLFTRDGQVRTVDPNILTQAGRGTASAFTEADELLGSDASPSIEVGVPTAEWIEIELIAPGEAPRIQRRTLFDLLGPAGRLSGATATPTADQLRDRALRVAGSSDILVLGATPSRRQLAQATTSTIAEAADILEALAKQPEPPAVGEVSEGRRLMLPLRRFAQERLAGNDRPALSAPNVFMLHQRLGWSREFGASAEAEIDIVFNDVVTPEEQFSARLKQGVTDSVLEAAMMDGGEGTAKDTVADILKGKNWTLLRVGDEHLLGALSPDLRMHVVSELTAGRLVLASLEPQSRGWWRIDPVTGNVLAMTPNGGGAAVEYARVARIVTYGMCILALGLRIGGANTAGASAGAACIILAGWNMIASELGPGGAAPKALGALGISGGGGA